MMFGYPDGQIWCTENYNPERGGLDLVLSYGDGTREFAVALFVSDGERVDGIPPKFFTALDQLKGWIGGVPGLSNMAWWINAH